MKILVGIDGGPQQTAALTLASRLAAGGELIVATVYPMSRTAVGLGSVYAKTVEDAAEEILQAARAEIETPGVDTRAVADISAPRALHHLAADEHVDLLVIGAGHRGPVGRVLLGGTGDRLVHGAPCPVVVAPRDYSAGTGPIRTIAVAYDGEAEAEAALAWAAGLAEAAGADLMLIAAAAFPVAMYPGWGALPWEELNGELRKEAQQRIDAAIERLPAGVHAEAVVLDGPVTESIVGAAADADLLVAGSRAYGAVGALLMGSVSRGLMHAAACPVVVVPRSSAHETTAADDSSLSAAD